MRVIIKPNIIPNQSGAFQHKCVAATSGIRSATRKTGDIDRHIDGSNPLRSFTILNAALNIAGVGGLAGFLGQDSKVVLAGFGTTWEEMLLPYRQLPAELKLRFSSPQLQRFVSLFPHKYSLDGDELIARGKISQNEKTMLLWLLDNDEERAKLKVFCAASHGDFLLGADLPLAEIYGIEYQRQHVEAAAQKLDSWINRQGNYPQIAGDRFYNGGESEGAYWYSSTYSLRGLDFDAKRLSDKIVLMQTDAADLSNIADQSIRLYFASGLLREEVFGGDMETPRRILEETVRILQPGGIFFLDEGEDALTSLGLSGLLQKHFDFHFIGQNKLLSAQIQSQLVLMGIISEEESLGDTGFWQKKGAENINLVLPDNTRIEEIAVPAQKGKDVWPYLEVMSVQDLIQANPVDEIELTANEKQILQRGVFAEPIVVDRKTGKVIDGLKRLKFMHQYDYIGIPALVFSDLATKEAIPFKIKSLFFPLDELAIPSNRPHNSEFAKMYLEFARQYLEKLSKDRRFYFRLVDSDVKIYQLELI